MTISAFRFPQLVRAVWTHPDTRRKRAFVAGVLAFDYDHALDICDCIVGCMVPQVKGCKFEVKFQTAELDREARLQDGHDAATPWRTLWQGRVGG